MGKFNGKVVIITGASSGIGEGAAIAFAKEGAKLTITGRNVERLTATGKKCQEASSEAPLELIGNMEDLNFLEMIVKKTVENFGGIDILVNNAGTACLVKLENTIPEELDNLFHVNVRAPTLLCKHALPYLKKSKGCVVNVSSVSSILASEYLVPYAMTKAALDQLTKGLAREWASYGVRANSINPASVPTRILASANLPKDVEETHREDLKKKQRFGPISPEQVSESIMYLCSAEMVTGVILPIDGAYLSLA